MLLEFDCFLERLRPSKYELLGGQTNVLGVRGRRERRCEMGKKGGKCGGNINSLSDRS